MSKKTTSKKKLGAANADLKKDLAVVRGRLSKTETRLSKVQGKADRWKSEAAAARRAATRSGARVDKLKARLDRATAALEPTRAVAPDEAAASGEPVAEPTAPDGVVVPDETWTVVQLRAEAHSRGLVGMSNKPKAQLLGALT